jgi:hypothetical protein
VESLGRFLTHGHECTSSMAERPTVPEAALFLVAGLIVGSAELSTEITGPQPPLTSVCVCACVRAGGT